MRALGTVLFVIVALLGLGPGHSSAQEPVIEEPYVWLLGEEVMTVKVVTIRESGELQFQFNGEGGEFRLDSIRLPDQESKMRKEAEKLLRKRLIGKSVEVHSRRTEKGGDLRVGYTLLDGEDVRVELVTLGLARYCQGNLRERHLERGEREAKKTERGIWGETDDTPVPSCQAPA